MQNLVSHLHGELPPDIGTVRGVSDKLGSNETELEIETVTDVDRLVIRQQCITATIIKSAMSNPKVLHIPVDSASHNQATNGSNDRGIGITTLRRVR